MQNVISSHTRITDHSKTLIDFAITGNPSKITNSGAHATDISDHDFIYISINLFRQKAQPKLIYVRNYNKIDIDKVRLDLERTTWHITELFDDANDALWCWQQLFKSTILDHVKTRKVKVRGNNQPWMSGEIRKAINKRYKLLIKARKTPRNSTDWFEYKRARNTCSKLIQNAKANFWKKEFQASSSPKMFWSTVRKFKGETKSQRIGPLEDGNKVILNDLEKANVMNSFLATIGKKLSNNKANQNDNSH